MLLLNAIQESLRTSFGDTVMIFVTRLADGGFLWVALSAILLFHPKYRKLGVTMIVAIGLEVLSVNFLLKPLVARPRPFEVNSAIQLLIPKPTGFSFPSGHAAVSFAAASVLYLTKSKGWIVGAILAVLIAFSRMYLYVHYPSDVLAGILIGAMAGWLSWFVIWKKRRPHTYTKCK